MAQKTNVAARAEAIGAPVAQQLGLRLWDVEFVKEGSDYFLRYYVDKDGGVTIDDCEAFSRAVDPELDRTDPIEQSYCLEVSSPGIERELKKDWHFTENIGKRVRVRLIRPDAAGRRDLEGTLEAFADGTATLQTQGGAVEIALSQAAHFRLADDALPGGE